MFRPWVSGNGHSKKVQTGADTALSQKSDHNSVNGIAGMALCLVPPAASRNTLMTHSRTLDRFSRYAHHSVASGSAAATTGTGHSWTAVLLPAREGRAARHRDGHLHLRRDVRRCDRRCSGGPNGQRVVLLEFGKHLGGLSSGGLSHTDGGDSSVCGGVARGILRPDWADELSPVRGRSRLRRTARTDKGRCS